MTFTAITNKALCRSTTAMALSLPLLACACLPKQSPADMPFRTGTIEHHENGQMRKARLYEATEIDGLLVDHWTHFHENGRAKGLRLAEDQELLGVSIPRKTYLWFDEEGHVHSAWLAKDLEIQGVQCNGGPGKIATYFHPNGRLKTVFLVDDALIQGVPCRASVFHPVCLDTEGRLTETTLSEAARVQGKSYDRGDRVKLRYD